MTAGEAGRVEQSKANDGMARNPCPVLSFLIEFPFRLRFFFFFRRGVPGAGRIFRSILRGRLPEESLSRPPRLLRARPVC